MGPPSYIQSVVDRNVVMRRMLVVSSKVFHVVFVHLFYNFWHLVAVHLVTCRSRFDLLSDVDIYRVSINYRRISLRHNLCKKCRKIVKFMSITHSER